MCGFSSSYGSLSGENGVKNILGHAAVPLAGHDSGKIYLIVGFGESGEGAPMLLLADGKTKPVSKPKAKKLKHLKVLPQGDEEVARLLRGGRSVDDSVIIHSLKKIRQSLSDPQEGGLKNV